MVSPQFPGIEHWVKYSLSKKKSLEEYAMHLRNHGYPPDDALERNETVKVLKVRRRRIYFNSKEVRYTLHTLHTQLTPPLPPLTHRKSPPYIPPLRQEATTNGSGAVFVLRAPARPFSPLYFKRRLPVASLGNVYY